MALKHDAQGFLVGDPIDIGRALAVWDDIRSDVRAIRKAVLGVGESPSGPWHDAAKVESYRRLGAGMEEADPAVKARRSTQDAALLRPTVTPGRKQDDKPQSVPKALAKPAVIPGGRDSRGRFVAAKPAADGGAGRGETPDGNGESALRGVADRIVSAVHGAGVGMEEADPAVKAFNEVAQPMARGYEFLTGGSEDKKQVGFLRRIFSALTGLRNDETAFNKAANKSLKNLETKPEGGKESGGGFLGMLLPFLTRIPVIGSAITGIASLLSKIPGFGGIGMAGGKGAGAAKPGLFSRLFGRGGAAVAGESGAVAAGAEGVAGAATNGGGLLSKAGGVAGKFAKKIPLIGSLLALGLGAFESSSIESDASTTREEKNAKQGKNWGGVGGGLAGAAAGAAIGSVVPVVGTIVGGVVGAVVGEWLGSSAGEIIGQNFSAITNSMSNGWNEIKVAALGTLDWIKSGWDSAVAGFDEVFKSISKTWGDFVDEAKAGVDTFTNLLSSAYEGLKSIPAVGDAIKLAEDAAKKAAEAAKTVASKTVDAAVAVKDKAVEVGTKAVDSTKSAAGAAWDVAKSVAANLVPEGLKNKVAARRAIETGADYKQGNISGLDDAHTRALVASTAATESGGGKLDVVNSAGYMGRYQAGAGWLADAGQINGGSAAVKAAMKADGFTSEYKWGQSGGMTRFLKDDKNWANGMSYDKYLASADAQDAAFKTNSDKSYQSLLKKGVITKDMSQDDIAGILKARHIAGEGGAAQAARGAEGPADANGTTALKYKTDLAAGNIYTKAFSSSPTTATPVAVAQAPAPAVSAAPVVATVQAPKAPSFSTPPTIADAPAIVDPLASNTSGSKKPAAVAVSVPDAGQDLRDRKIAHIVTGGLSSA